MLFIKLIRVKTCFLDIFFINTSTLATLATFTTSIVSPLFNKSISIDIEPIYYMNYDEEALRARMINSDSRSIVIGVGT